MSCTRGDSATICSYKLLVLPFFLLQMEATGASCGSRVTEGTALLHEWRHAEISEALHSLPHVVRTPMHIRTASSKLRTPALDCIVRSYSSVSTLFSHLTMFAQLTLTAKPPAAAARRVNACASSKSFCRRQLCGMAGAVSPFVFGQFQAQALLAYDDDEEMVEKAKANRSKRLKEVRLASGVLVSAR